MCSLRAFLIAGFTFISVFGSLPASAGGRIGTLESDGAVDGGGRSGPPDSRSRETVNSTHEARPRTDVQSGVERGRSSGEQRSRSGVERGRSGVERGRSNGNPSHDGSRR